ncbi:MAG: hypothetical protein U0411_13940 [Thermodesulfovibrionales bacterium]
MEKVDGMQILKRCRDFYPDTEVIIITGYATLKTAVDSMKYGPSLHCRFQAGRGEEGGERGRGKSAAGKENRQLRGSDRELPGR